METRLPHQVQTADLKLVDSGLVGVRRLIVKISKTPPYYFTTNQSEKYPWADDTSCDPFPITLSLNTLAWKPLVVWVFWALTAHSPCLAPCSKCCIDTFLHHSPVWMYWLCHALNEQTSPVPFGTIVTNGSIYKFIKYSIMRKQLNQPPTYYNLKVSIWTFSADSTLELSYTSFSYFSKLYLLLSSRTEVENFTLPLQGLR